MTLKLLIHNTNGSQTNVSILLFSCKMGVQGFGCYVAFPVLAVFVCISATMNSQFCDSEWERGLKKRQEVSLGSRIVGNICYHRRGELVG